MRFLLHPPDTMFIREWTLTRTSNLLPLPPPTNPYPLLHVTLYYSPLRSRTRPETGFWADVVHILPLFTTLTEFDWYEKLSREQHNPPCVYCHKQNVSMTDSWYIYVFLATYLWNKMEMGKKSLDSRLKNLNCTLHFRSIRTQSVSIEVAIQSSKAWRFDIFFWSSWNLEAVYV